MPLTSTTNLSGIQVTSMATEAYFESRQSFSLFTKKRLWSGALSFKIKTGYMRMTTPFTPVWWSIEDTATTKTKLL